MNLPKRHPQYGGTLTYYKDLEVGTEFYVCNGAWNGKIIEVDGVKKVYVHETKATHDITDTRYDWLSITEPTKNTIDTKYSETPEIIISGEKTEDKEGEKLFQDLYDYVNSEVHHHVDFIIYSDLFDKIDALYEHFIEYAS